MIPESAGLGRECAGAAAPPAAGGRGAAPAAAPAAPSAPTLAPMPKIAAVINWFGITDVPDVIDGANRQAAAARWFGNMPLPEALTIARTVSPLTYVRAGLPPIITIHGDADRTVPYPEAVRLHEALAKVNVPNQLVTIANGGHGGFSAEERIRIYTTIREFLTKNGVALK